MTSPGVSHFPISTERAENYLFLVVRPTTIGSFLVSQCYLAFLVWLALFAVAGTLPGLRRHPAPSLRNNVVMIMQ